jgi:alanine racemase
MGGYHGAYDEVAHRDVVPVVYDEGQVEALARAARSAGEPISVHVKIDTGMSRLGVRMEDLERFASRLAGAPEVRVAGLMTHLACADAPDPSFTNDQVTRFDEATQRLARAGITAPIRHAANSAAVLRGHAVYDLVRPGIAIFGVSPFARDLKPVMRVRSEIVDLRTIQPGETAGYGALFRAARLTRIATLPIGYADGLSRYLSNKGHVLVHGVRSPIVGAISMDMCMIDVTDVPGAELRDEVVVLGAQGKDAIGAEEIASHGATIAWEVLTSISRRVPRFYREP